MKRTTILVALLCCAAFTSADQDPVRIRFARGASAGEVSGSLVRGQTARYAVGARAGQRMRVRITAPEENAVFQLYAPGRPRTALPGAAEGDDARTWSGRLPASGDYLLVVGGTRGNASYRLRMEIR